MKDFYVLEKWYLKELENKNKKEFKMKFKSWYILEICRAIWRSRRMTRSLFL